MNQRTGTVPDPTEGDGARHDVIRPERLLYSVREVAELLSLGRVKVYELLATGKIESVKLDGSRRIPRDSLEAYIDRLRAESGSF